MSADIIASKITVHRKNPLPFSFFKHRNSGHQLNLILVQHIIFHHPSFGSVIHRVSGYYTIFYFIRLHFLNIFFSNIPSGIVFTGHSSEGHALFSIPQNVRHVKYGGRKIIVNIRLLSLVSYCLSLALVPLSADPLNPLFIHTVVRRFLGDMNIMRMAFF